MQRILAQARSTRQILQEQLTAAATALADTSEQAYTAQQERAGLEDTVAETGRGLDEAEARARSAERRCEELASELQLTRNELHRAKLQATLRDHLVGQLLEENRRFADIVSEHERMKASLN